MTSRRRAEERGSSSRSAPASGVGWHEHDCRLFSGTEAFYRHGYRANLVDGWLPALEGVGAALRGGARVADVGCGHGARRY